MANSVLKKLLASFTILLFITSPFAQDIHSNIIIAKVKNEYRSSCSNNDISIPALKSQLDQNHINKITRRFKNTSLEENKKLYSDISLMYIFNYIGNDIESAIQKLSRLKYFQYVEPKYINTIQFHIPDDPAADTSTGQQIALKMHKMYDAWDISKGDSNILIAIADAGTHTTHEDMIDNIYRNVNDPIDGIDNDNDGLTDNYLGWDFGDDDNDPQQMSGSHGVAVCGLAGATTNNATGIAGFGYNSKIVPLKSATDASPNSISRGYEALQFAALKGYDVINLSWGCVNCHSQASQDIVNNAVIDNDVVVISAAGNWEQEVAFYPASYDNVISVSSVDPNFEKWVNRSWHYYVDMVSHGVGVYTLNANGSYQNQNGTSFSAPMVSGAAALVRDVFPNYTASQVMEQLRVTTDSIYHKSGNLPYYEKLGKGSMNVLNALTNTTSPAIRNIQRYTDTTMFVLSDTNYLTGTFVNYLNPASNLTVTLSSTSPYVHMIDSVISIGAVNTFDTVVNSTNKFSFTVDTSAPNLEEIWFRFGYSDVNYDDFQYLPSFLNPDFINIDENEIFTTANSTGNFGYTAPDNSFGVGFKFNDTPLLYEAGLMLSTEDTALKVSDNIRNENAGFINDDFKRIQAIKEVDPGAFSDFKATCIFSDTASGLNNVGTKVKANYYAWNNAPDDQYLIVEYEITNLNSDSIHDLHCGIYADWDIIDPYNNLANWDHEEGFGYVSDSNVYAAIKPLWPYYGRYFAIDNPLSTYFSVYDGFTDEEKHQSLSTVGPKISAGIPNTTDVSHTVSVNLGDLASGETKIMAFAIMAGNSMEELRASANAAQNKYGNQVIFQAPSPTTFDTITCYGTSTSFRVAGGDKYLLYYGENDYLVMAETLPFMSADIYDTTTYYVAFPDGDFPGIKAPVNITPYQPVADFWIEPDTLYFEDRNYVYLHNTSPVLDTLWWDFGNGYSSNAITPSISYSDTGIYNITLHIIDSINCYNNQTLPLVILSGSEPTDGINMISQLLTVSPNPFHNSIRIDGLPNQNNLIEVYNSYGGKIIESQTLQNSVTIQLGDDYPTGIYFLKVNGETFKMVKK